LATVAKKGLVQVFTGNGKGKTTAALGTVLRAAGHDLKIFVVFFMKGNYKYGEFATLSKLPNVDKASFGSRRLIDRSNVKPEDREQAQLALATAREAALSGKYDMVVMDEVNVALAFHLIAPDDVIKLIKEKPSKVELILTGRYADEKIIEY
jgi:cob(I)alamin adenosyltransferase